VPRRRRCRRHTDPSFFDPHRLPLPFLTVQKRPRSPPTGSEPSRPAASDHRGGLRRGASFRTRSVEFVEPAHHECSAMTTEAVNGTTRTRSRGSRTRAARTEILTFTERGCAPTDARVDAPSSRDSAITKCSVERCRSTRPGFPRACAIRTLPPSMGFDALRRFQKQAATNTGITSPGCAAPSGFLNLMTLCSARNLSGLVSCR
jgi:hypothetical protein